MFVCLSAFGLLNFLAFVPCLIGIRLSVLVLPTKLNMHNSGGLFQFGSDYIHLLTTFNCCKILLCSNYTGIRKLYFKLVSGFFAVNVYTDMGILVDMYDM